MTHPGLNVDEEWFPSHHLAARCRKCLLEMGHRELELMRQHLGLLAVGPPNLFQFFLLLVRHALPDLDEK